MTRPVVHIIGAQRSNFPWGFECKVIATLDRMGVQVRSTDFRLEARSLPSRLRQPCDLVLVFKGEWLPPRLFRQVQSPLFLWFAEFVGRPTDIPDTLTLHNRQMLAYNGLVFDVVFTHDESSLAVCASLGCRQVGWLPTAAVDPAVHQRLGLEKAYDVLFIGGMTPRRRAILDELSQHFNATVMEVRDPQKANQLYNQARIVLNIHAGEALNTETRLCEVLGAGSFLLSEQISSPQMFHDRTHLVYWRQGDWAQLTEQIDYYLRHEDEREQIASQGYVYVHTEHTLEKRVRGLLSAAGLAYDRPPRIFEARELVMPGAVSALPLSSRLWALKERAKARLRDRGLRRSRLVNRKV